MALAANGEVHTNEEAQVFVHDLNLFVTVQLLDETPAVLSQGKLCKDHGYSYEWISGQKPRLAKEDKTIVCNTDNLVPLVVSGLSTSSGIHSSSTSPPQDSLSTSSSTSPSPDQERSDELAPGDWCRSSSKNTQQNKKKDDSRDADDRLRDLSEWLEEFTDYLEDAEVHAPAHISQDSDSERHTKVVSISRKHSISTHFPKDRSCEVCLRTKSTRAPCRRRIGEVLLRAEKFGDLTTADHKVLDEGWEFQDLATQGIQSYPCKSKISQETEKSYESSSIRRKNPKLLILTIHWSLENLVKIYHGIIEHQHLIDRRQTALLKERYDE